MNHPAPLYPPALKKGDKIGIIAPASHITAQALQPSIDLFKANGLEVVVHPQTTYQHGQFAGTPTQRIDALHDYLKDDSIKAIFCARGGNGAIHLLDQINYKLVRRNPKLFIGSSNITTLCNAIYSRTGLITFHGPMSLNLNHGISKRHAQDMVDTLMGQPTLIPIDTNINMSGTLLGGNLSDMQTLIGTPYAPDLTGAVLMFEDINDHFSRYDRMIGHMKQAGWLNNLNCIILGDFLNTQDNAERPFGFTIEEIVRTHAPNTPIVTNAPFGHGANLCTLPIGAKITLKNGTLSFKSLS